MPDQINRHTLALKNLAGLALIRSGVNRKTLADALGTTEGPISRKLSPEHPHEFDLTELLVFEVLTGDRTLVDYIHRELGHMVMEDTSA